MLKKYVIVIGMLLFVLSSRIWAGPPPISARIWGTLTIIEVMQITNENCTLLMSAECKKYTIEVKHSDGTAFNPEAKTNDLNFFNNYIIDIPIYEQESQPEGAIPGDMAVIHVYDENGNELTVKTPPKGHIIVGNSADISKVDLVLQDDSYPANITDEKIYTQEEFDSERRKWDANNDLKVGLEDAIHALQVISGVRNQMTE